MSVATLALPKLTTMDEFCLLPDNGARCELLKGVVLELPPAGYEHGDLTMNVAAALKAHAQAHQLGRVVFESGFVVSRDPDTVRAPDCAFVSAERVPVPRPEKYFEGPPDLAVEVVSPGDTASDVHEKVTQWLDAGARLVWVIYPRTRTVVVYNSRKDATILRDDDTLSGEGVVPGFELPVGRIFE